MKDFCLCIPHIKKNLSISGFDTYYQLPIVCLWSIQVMNLICELFIFRMEVYHKRQ